MAGSAPAEKMRRIKGNGGADDGKVGLDVGNTNHSDKATTRVCECSLKDFRCNATRCGRL